MKVRVHCEFVIEVELPDDVNAEFIIEDNGCPGTGVVWAKLKELIEKHDAAGTCWACASGGTCAIVGTTT